MQQFESARLLMRPLCAEDETLYITCYTDPLLMKHIAKPLTREAALRSFNAALKVNSTIPVRRYMWAMDEKASMAPVGLLSLVCEQTANATTNVELGHFMLTRYHNKGFTVEAINELIDVVFVATDFAAFVVNHDRANRAVERVVKKLGFMPDMGNSENISNYRWTLSRHHWQKLKASTNPM